MQAAKLHAWSFVCVYLIQRCLHNVNARAMLLLSGHHPTLNARNYERETLGQEGDGVAGLRANFTGCDAP